ncbi:MAG: hypothetical protein OXE50_15635, partial [Chloroflexi bacterium]|nr:hypothetical protein [Chloroflexota bacterium]
YRNDMIGGIYKINPSGLEKIGSAGRNDLVDPRPTDAEYTTNPYYGVFGGTASPMVADDELYFIAGFGNLSRVGIVPVLDIENAPESHINNWLLKKITDKVSFTIDELRTNGRTLGDMFQELAEISLSSYGFRNTGEFFFEEDNALYGITTNNLTLTSDTFTVEKISKSAGFPESGYVLIDDELLRYSTNNDGVISNVLRGQKGTEASLHNIGATAFYVDHFLGFEDSSPILDLNVEQDKSQVQNVIFVNYEQGKSVEKQDDDSIEVYGRKEYPVDTSLASDRYVLANHIATETLKRFKNSSQVITIDIFPNTLIEIGDTVLIKETVRAHLFNIMRVVEIGHEKQGENQKTVVKGIVLK